MSFGAVDELLARLADQDAVLVRVEATQGSAPREAGTWMAVWPDALPGTIGGGQLEFQAIGEARAVLNKGQLYMATFDAPRLNFYDTLLPEFHALSDSAQLP